MKTRKVKTEQKTSKVAKPVENSANNAVLETFTTDNGKIVQVLNFEPGRDQYATKLGFKKLKFVLENLDIVRRFVASEGKSI